jgi:predicted Holliday junction resolvase-like endonuclease
MFEMIIILFIISIALLLFYILYLKKERNLIIKEMDIRAEKKFLELKEKLRKEILNKSRAGIKGKIGEQIAPFTKQFKYNPSDARFIGSPIDYVIFNGYTELKDTKKGKSITVVFVEIKTGEKASLTYLQRKIKRAIEEKNVKWETIHLKNRSN